MTVGDETLDKLRPPYRGLLEFDYVKAARPGARAEVLSVGPGFATYFKRLA